jgi:transposase-like protein
MISHDESANLRRFKCVDCGKAFKFKHHLKVRDNDKDKTKRMALWMAEESDRVPIHV